jgi:succinylglutamic semialdehyde dehydrogenase
MTHPDQSDSNAAAGGWTLRASHAHLLVERPGSEMRSADPVTREEVWRGRSSSLEEIDGAVAAARAAQADWFRRTVDERAAVLKSFAGRLAERRAELATMISREVGKPMWESLTEADAMIGKIPLTIAATAERCRGTSSEAGGVLAATRFKPHGVVAVIGPFNFPGHLPNGHIAPALLAGNAVVFKPSEYAPATAAMTVELWREAGLPDGLLGLVQGGKIAGEHLVGHNGIDGIFFTGSGPAGLSMRRALVDRPDKILAIEMGGNNPLVVGDVADLRAAVYLTIQSAYITAGQRCTCARRLIVPEGPVGDRFVDALAAAVTNLSAGHYTKNPEPFMGPVIHETAAISVIHAEQVLIKRGGRPLVPCGWPGRNALVTPGLIEVTGVTGRPDEEIFGPLLQLIRVPDFDAAIIEANNTGYGLAAGLIDDSRPRFEEFYHRVRAGCVNWNRPTTGASGALPFGGVGMSGNHRPSGYLAADYCAYPVASLESERAALPPTLLPGVTL